MSNKDEELKKYVNTSPISTELENKGIGLELKTNIEAFQEGSFPEKLMDEIKLPQISVNDEIQKEIEAKHASILDERPVPDLLETADLVDSLNDLKAPVMGKLYEEKVKDKKVTWSLLGKTITSDIIRKEEISVGGLRDYDETRYVIKLDVEFLGSIYETEFTLDDREDRTPILFDREFMNRMNVMVNPNRKYVVTTKYSLD